MLILIIMGDFNEIMSRDEKRGGALYPEWLWHGFRAVIADSNLCQVHSVGYKFTWSRSLGVHGKVEEKLDRGFACHTRSAN